MLLKTRLFLLFILVIAFAVTTVFNSGGNFWGTPVEAEEAEVEEREEKHFTILHTNDIHSRVHRFPLLAGAVNEIRDEKEAKGEPVLLTDGADFLGTLTYYWLNLMGYAPELQMMQKVGYDAITLGNHEFDLGSRGLARLFKNAGYPDEDLRPVIVASNTEPPEEHPLAAEGLFTDSHIKELENGLKVGFMGVHGRSTIPGSGLDLFKSGPVNFPDPHEVAREKVAEFEEKEVDIIILLIHENWKYNLELAADVSGIDIILAGHEHETYEPEFVNDTIIIQTSANLEDLCMLELAYDPSNESIRLRNEELGNPYHLPLDDAEEDKDVADFVLYFEERLDEAVKDLTDGEYEGMDDIVARSGFEFTSELWGSSAIRMQETNMGNFATDAIRIVAGEKLGERIDFSLLPSGLCSSSLESGEITFGDLAAIPLAGTGPDLKPGHPLVSFYLTGEEVRRIMEIFYFISYSGFRNGHEEYPQISGLRLDYNPDRTIIFNVPFQIIDLFGDETPVPSMRTVVNAEKYTGEGPQSTNDEDYEPLPWGDEQLYHVVTESYVLFFLPILEEVLHILPMLEIIPKDKEGEPIRYMDDEGDIAPDVVVYDVEGNEVKAWQALVEYAAMQPQAEDGIPEISPYYVDTMERANEVWTVPFYVWFILAIIALVVIIVLIRRIFKRRKERKEIKAG